MNFEIYMGKAIEAIKNKGAFLTVKDKERLNTMTIGWANIGYQWKKPILTVMVRKSRYTYDIIENSKEFTVSIPLNVDVKQELITCGTKSYRDINKFKECNLKVQPSNKVVTPVIGNCDMHFECKILYKQEMDSEFLYDEIKESCYKNGDYHVFYYGEILDCYINQ
ncbi:flavin reductase family protein [Clostridium rectalis]|uniref:flavin reductase family protein n=1 Tax=Clostridium rectalis TaxID=2040295 RepID=UPI000F62FFDF|nr:flavin reductase family protein [Clostridium rectalis]